MPGLTSSDPAYIRRRRLQDGPERLGRTRRPQPNKLTRFKNATINWLNGLPPVDYDSALQDFHADHYESRPSSRLDTPRDKTHHDPLVADRPHDQENNAFLQNGGETAKERSFRRKLRKLRRILFERQRDAPDVVVDVPVSPISLGDDKDAAGGKIRMQHIEEAPFLESRPAIREIFLPPDYASQRRFLQNLPSLTPQMRRRFAESHPWTVSNEIRTAKYTVLTFLPKNLFEQFRRVANVYFLILIVLQGIPIFSNTNVILAASPLVSILVVTGIKDAVEDWKRQKSDTRVNHSVVSILRREGDETRPDDDEEGGDFRSALRRWRRQLMRVVNRGLFREKIVELAETEQLETGQDGGANEWKRAYWKDVRVGDIILIRNNESIPADVIVLSSSDPLGICYVETKNLDGETNLKIRQAPIKTAWIRTPDEAASLAMALQVEPPSTRLYTFAGKMILPREREGEGEYDATLPLESRETVNLDAEAIPITSDHLLLRGCQIRNTEFVVGVVAYTGIHTKIIMNSGRTPSKRSRIERQMNPQIILSFVLLFVICLTCAISQGQYVGGSIATAPYWYTVYKTGAMASPIFTGFLTFWSSLILFQTLVPISLYITVEVCKLVQAFFIHLDLKMYYPERDQRAVPRSWNIADDLGQIEYIFSDKTGTLTCNVMEFRRCSIGGRMYGHLTAGTDKKSFEQECPSRSESAGVVSAELFAEMEAQMTDSLRQLLPYKYIPPVQQSFVDPTLLDDLLNDGDTKQSEHIRTFFLAVAMCHTILIDRLSMDEETFEHITELPASKAAPHLLQYQAQSPDEAALVKAARDLGFVFLGRSHNTLNLCVLGELQSVEVLHVIEFNSTRKRMSVLVRRANGQIWLLCKGADSVIYERLERERDDGERGDASGPPTAAVPSLETATLRHLEAFAEAGLRTLCFAARRLSEEEYAVFSARYSEASASMTNRELLMDAVAEEYEKELTLLGATAIEDRLQTGVPEAISALQLAGIKLWVLTGDKMETAVNIGFSCRLLRRNMFLIMVRAEDQTVQGTRRQLDEGHRKLMRSLYPLQETEDEPGDEGPTSGTMDCALIIDGVSLKHAMEDCECRALFLDLATNCRAVLCCRVSPLQKAKVVELVKKTRNVMTLAIGDGANDVSMIQEADVGVGIAGEEGMQAVMSSDYAIAQFAHLERLLLVHGRLSYVRTAKVTLLCFCKNVSFVLVAFWYQIFCAFTAQYTYDYMYLLYFNMIFTVLPVLLLGMLDRQVSDVKLQQAPQLYQDGLRQRYYSMRLFLTYSAIAIYQSLVCYFLPQFFYYDTAVVPYGYPESKTMIGNVQGFATILAINCFTASHMESWNWIFIGGFVLTGIVFLAFVLVYLFLPFSTMRGSWGDFLQVRFWAALVLTFTVALAPTLLYPFVRGWIWPKRPTDIELVREIEHEQRKGRGWELEAALRESVRTDDDDDKTAMTRQLKDRWTLCGDEDVSVPERLLVTHRMGGPRSRTHSALSVSSHELAGGVFSDHAEHDMWMAGRDDGSHQHTDYSAHDTPAHDNHRPRRQSTLRRIRRHFRLFNVRTGEMEDIHGFAFSQDQGTGQLLSRPPSDADQPANPPSAFLYDRS